METKDTITHENYVPSTHGNNKIIGLLSFCSNKIEKWQIENELDYAFSSVTSNNKPYVFNTQFEYLQQLRLELQNNVSLFKRKEGKFRAIEKWISAKMSDKSVMVSLEPLSFDLQSQEDVKKTILNISKSNTSNMIINLLKQMDLIEQDGITCLVSGKRGSQKGTVLFATIAAIREKNSDLLLRDYNYQEITDAFDNTYRNNLTNLTYKSDGKDFKNQKNIASNKLKLLLKKNNGSAI